MTRGRLNLEGDADGVQEIWLCYETNFNRYQGFIFTNAYQPIMGCFRERVRLLLVHVRHVPAAPQARRLIVTILVSAHDTTGCIMEVSEAGL